MSLSVVSDVLLVLAAIMHVHGSDPIPVLVISILLLRLSIRVS